MGFNAVRLDRNEEMPTISHADINPPGTIRFGPTSWFARDFIICTQPAFLEQEDRSVGPVLLLIHRVDALERAPKADVGSTDSFHGENGAGEITSCVRRAARVKEIAVARRPKRVSAGLVPAGGVAGGIGVKMVVEDKRRA